MEAVVLYKDSNAPAGNVEVATTNPTPRLAGPDLLRAIAILLVMLWHLPRPARLPMLQGLREYSWTGVDLFFVLSGYLIGMQLLRPLALGQRLDIQTFYLKRSLRILPTFLVVLAVYVFVPALGEGSQMQPVWRFLTFSMNFGLDFTVTGTFTQACHFASKSIFICCYLCSCWGASACKVAGARRRGSELAAGSPRKS